MESILLAAIYFSTNVVFLAWSYRWIVNPTDIDDFTDDLISALDLMVNPMNKIDRYNRIRLLLSLAIFNLCLFGLFGITSYLLTDPINPTTTPQ
jgi:hypothetical protein